MLRLLLFLLAFTATGAVAQQVDTIRASPDAKKLRVIWTSTGQTPGANWGERFALLHNRAEGRGTDFGVYERSTLTWWLFRGGVDTPATTPFQGVYGSIDNLTGQFLGDGRRYFGLRRLDAYLPFGLHPVDTDGVDTNSGFIVNARTLGVTSEAIAQAAGDLDGDGADELVLYFRSIHGDTTSLHGELWIYRGGPDFQVDSPTVRIAMNEPSAIGIDPTNWTLRIGRFDNDSLVDLCLEGAYSSPQRPQLHKLKYWLGRPGSPWNWGSTPDREREHNWVYPRNYWGDFDGDGVSDLAMPTADDTGRVLLYLSTRGDLATRSLADEDADRAFYAPGFTRVRNGGYVNDASRRYEMLTIEGPAPGPSIAGFTAYFGGGPNGPDNVYEAYWSSLYDFGGYPIAGAGVHGDITGDGYDEHLLGKPSYGNGIAFILAGGPDIPKDPSAGVRWTATEERERAIAIWPNPARDVVHIAWRGDLTRRPLSFIVYDASGELVAKGEADPRQGEVEWRCEGRAAGTYLIVMRDQHGQALASSPVVIVR